MSEDAVTTVIFEGIASVDVEGVAHDVYLTARTEHHGYAVRWFGDFEWMGSTPKTFKPGGFFDLSLSDGREAKIRIPHLSAEESGRLAFLGQGLPPGFEMFAPETVTAEIRSTTLPVWRLVTGRVLAILAFFLMFSAIWAEDNQWKFLATGFIVSVMSVQLVTPGKGRQLKEVLDDDRD